MKQLFFGVTLGIVFGYFITKYLLIGTFQAGYVNVTVRNESRQHIKSLLLKSNSGSIVTNGLQDMDEATLTFKNGSEGVYFIVSTFDNDSTLTSKPMYIEGGYKTTEIVFRNRIQSENQ